MSCKNENVIISLLVNFFFVLRNVASPAINKENLMAKKISGNMGLYLVKPEVKPGVIWPSIPKDAKPSESQYAYFARKYMAAQAARSVSEKKDQE